MLVTFTNAGSDDVFLSCLYVTIAAGAAVSTRRTRAELEADQVLKAYVVAGTITLGFTEETGDDAAVGLDSTMASYTNGTRPAASAVPIYSSIYNTSDNAPNYSDGTNWRDSAGSIT